MFEMVENSLYMSIYRFYKRHIGYYQIMVTRLLADS